MIFAVSDRAQCKLRRLSVICDPSVPKTGIISDMVEARVDFAEFLADTFDEGAYVGAISLRAVSGNEVFSMNQIIDLTIADVLYRSLRYQSQDLEFRQREFDSPTTPQGPVRVVAQG